MVHGHWAVFRGQSLEVQASRLAPRGRRTGGYLVGLLDLIRIGSRGEGVCWRSLQLGPWTDDGWVEAAASDFVWTRCKI